jgi:enoyl-CoA hydratase/carnithine racemase
MEYQFIEVANEGALTIITINRPHVRNALNAVSHVELAHAFDGFASDERQWVAIITGAGEQAFCAGHDLKQDPGAPAPPLPPTGFAGLVARFDLTKPVIAAVNGVCVGGGFEIALAADIVVAAESAAFALPEPRVGLAALAGGILRLPREIGLKRAMGLMLTGRKVSAREGLELGFVNEVVERDALAAARRWADDILQCSPMAIRATKEVALQGLMRPLDEALAELEEYPAVKAMWASQDSIEGPAAFAAKRPPRWTGR